MQLQYYIMNWLMKMKKISYCGLKWKHSEYHQFIEIWPTYTD